MTYSIRSAIVIALVPIALSCQSVAEQERTLTQQCKKEPTCTKQGLCTGRCSGGPCRCVVASSADCAQSTQCSGEGLCTEKNGKCVIATSADCAKTAACKSVGFCTAKEGACVAGSDDDCKKSDACTSQQKCVAKNNMCVDPAMVPGLLNPALAKEQTPDSFKVKFSTTKGDFVVEVTRAWAPFGAERFYNLVKVGYYKDVAFFRVDDTRAEFGINGKPEISAAWSETKIRDELPKQPNDRGFVAFVTSGPNSRWAPLVIHVKSNRKLDEVGYAPIGKVVEGMQVVDKLNKEYGEGPPTGKGPDKVKLLGGGNVYLKGAFPALDYVTGTAVL